MRFASGIDNLKRHRHYLAIRNSLTLMLFLDSYPPVPLSTWKGGTHSFGFSYYEGAVRGSRTAGIRNSLALMLSLDSHPLPPPTWEGVLHS